MYSQGHTLFDRASFYYTSCSSTNDIAQKYLLYAAEGTVVISDYQYKGRGQRGTTWDSESGKNLLFSIILYPEWLIIDYIFSLNIIASLAIYDVLISHFPNKISIKWPNDIYYLDKKLGGILIETNLKENHKLKTVIIGIGLNVNQLHFESSQATSLSLHKGTSLDRSCLLTNIIDALGKYYGQLQSGMVDLLWEKYRGILYRKTGFHMFSTIDGLLEGSIITVNKLGDLVIARRNGKKHSYKPKEIAFI